MAISPAPASAPPARLPPLHPRSSTKPSIPNETVIKRRLLRGGVAPTPKILHAIRKKETQKSLRRSKKHALQQDPPPLTDSQRQALDEDAHFRAVSAEYRALKAELAGKPWEGAGGVDVRVLTSVREGDGSGRLKGEHLEELRGILAERNGEGLRWLLDADVEETGGLLEERGEKPKPKKRNGDEEKIRYLVQRLNSTELDMHDWRFSRLMRQSGLLFNEIYLLRIVEALGVHGNWRHAISVVEWVYRQKDYIHQKSRFVYTKLLAVLGKARMPNEALKIFNAMREDGLIYPDMAAYHSIAVTLGQAGLVKELMHIIECMSQKPSERLKNMKRRNWDPCLEPDVIVYNAVVNACVLSQQWKGVFWVLEQMRHNGMKPTGATYGLAMEVMLKAGKYDHVHSFFEKMRRSGLPPKALTYKVLVRAFWKEGRVDEAVIAVRDMEQRGVVGTASVYYELACCLCNNGRWQDAMLEVEKLKKLPRTKPLEVTFTGMILSSFDGGHVSNCMTIFKFMKEHCIPNIGTINAMLKVYGRNDMFAKAKELFESIKDKSSGGSALDNGDSLKPDAYSYSSILEASASAQQWDYFEYVYKDMSLRGHRLDQTKHSWLLIKASKSGKWHLLEHAFDTILEAGEIPHVSLFFEMICQTICQRDYDRTVSLINGMAHASIQVKEHEWISLFHKRSRDFTEEGLQDLLNHLANSNLVTEDPVPNFLKSLQSFCGPRLSKEDHLLATPGDISINATKVQGYCPSRTLVSDDDHPQCGVEDDIFSVDYSNTRNQGDDCLQETPDMVPTVGNGGNDSDYILLSCADTSTTDDALDMLTAHIGNSFSKLPSASDILESWREDRVKDGVFQNCGSSSNKKVNGFSSFQQ